MVAPRTRCRQIVPLMTAALVTVTMACASRPSAKYMHPNADLGAIKKVAILPLENLTNERAAADKITKILLIEVLTLEVFDVVEPGQVTKVLKTERVESTEALTPSDLKKIGETLGAQGLFIGTVVDFAETRSGNTPTPEVTIQLRLVETQSGATVWSASETRSGAKASARLFGIGGESLTEAARQLIRKELRTLLQ
jgi:TolB-like protein